MAEVSCRKVVKEYDGGVQAVKGIDLDIADHDSHFALRFRICANFDAVRLLRIRAGEDASVFH